jgi:hypothetical protein
VFDRPQQVRVNARQPSQRSGIEPIMFPIALSDQAQVARRGHDQSTVNFRINRLTHLECIPVSSSIRLRGIRTNSSFFMAFGV